MRLWSQTPHLAQDTGLVAHGAPRVGEADRKVKRGQDRNGGRISGAEVQSRIAAAMVCVDDIAMLVVHPDSELEAAPEQEQMPSGAAAYIDHPHPVRDDVVKKFELGPQEGLDLGRLCGRIQSPIQQASRVDFFVCHESSRETTVA